LWRLDRLGRILGDLIHLTNELKSRNVEFESLTEKGRPHERENKVAEVFAKTSLLQRKVGLENKAITGRLLVILAITKADECVAYCVCSVGNESSHSGTDKVGEIDSMFILTPYRRQGTAGNS
jgi:hypothetical protein